MQDISNRKFGRIFFCPETFVTPLWGNIMMIYGHWDLQNSNLGSQEARKAKKGFSRSQKLRNLKNTFFNFK